MAVKKMMIMSVTILVFKLPQRNLLILSLLMLQQHKLQSIDFDDIAICEYSDLEVCEDSDSDMNNEDEPSIEDIQETYQEIYDNWINVCNVNKSLKDKLFELACHAPTRRSNTWQPLRALEWASVSRNTFQRPARHTDT